MTKWNKFSHEGYARVVRMVLWSINANPSLWASIESLALRLDAFPKQSTNGASEVDTGAHEGIMMLEHPYAVGDRAALQSRSVRVTTVTA